jgi:glycosyltransferase involved in cell wall biosynthesis
MPDSSWLTKFIYGNCYKVVSITNAMQKEIKKKHGLTNVTTIYNPIDMVEVKLKATEETQLDFVYIIAVGEYDTNIKQFDLLIKTYSESILPKRNIHLVILGTGKLMNYLLSIARDNNVEPFVHLLGFEKNPYKYISKAKFLVLSSKYEGLPMVVLESLACGTPTIAFDCPTGPKEIIINKENGLLIEDQNTDELREGMNSFIDNEKLYLNCKEGTTTSIKQFDIEVVGKQWLDLMNNKP